MIKIDGVEYITVREAASVLGVSTSRMTTFFRDGRLKTYRVLGRKLLRPADVALFAQSRRRQPGRPPGSPAGGLRNARKTRPGRGRGAASKSPAGGS